MQGSHTLVMFILQEHPSPHSHLVHIHLGLCLQGGSPVVFTVLLPQLDILGLSNSLFVVIVIVVVLFSLFCVNIFFLFIYLWWVLCDVCTYNIY